MFVTCVQVSSEARMECWLPWTSSYRWLSHRWGARIWAQVLWKTSNLLFAWESTFSSPANLLLSINLSVAVNAISQWAKRTSISLRRCCACFCLIWASGLFLCFCLQHIWPVLPLASLTASSHLSSDFLGKFYWHFYAIPRAHEVSDPSTFTAVPSFLLRITLPLTSVCHFPH